MTQPVLPFAVLILAVTTTVAAADNWPQFRGPHGDAVVHDAFPLHWDATSNVRWKAEAAGEGWSAPVVWNGKLFLTAAVMTKKPPGGPQNAQNRRRQNRPRQGRPGRNQRRGRGRGGYGNNLASAEYRWEVRCLDTNNGDVLWKQVTRAGKPPQGRHMQNTYATETPVTDGERVYAYFGMNGVYCFDVDGTPIWQKDPGNYEMRNDWGTSSSPALHDGSLYLQIDSQEQSFLVALDAKSGDEVWRANREEPSQYSSPVIWENSSRVEVVTGGQTARSYDPKSGKLLWQLSMAGGRSSATPLAIGDRLYIGSELRNRGGDDDGGGYLFAVNPGAQGEITANSSDSVAWALPQSGIQMASPVFCEGHLYLFERRKGVLRCINADTGEIVYAQRVSGARSFWSSPWVYQDKVFCLDNDGTTYVFQGGPEYQVLHTNKLGEPVWSTPAIAAGCVFVRTSSSLYCIGPQT